MHHDRTVAIFTRLRIVAGCIVTLTCFGSLWPGSSLGATETETDPRHVRQWTFGYAGGGAAELHLYPALF